MNLTSIKNQKKGRLQVLGETLPISQAANGIQPRPVGGQVADTVGTQVLFPLLWGWFWRFCLCLGKLQSLGELPRVPWLRSAGPEASYPLPTLLSCSMADKNGALKCTFSAPSHSTSLLQGLAALRSQGQLLDIVLTVNRETFHAHKVVLAACSDYFR